MFTLPVKGVSDIENVCFHLACVIVLERHHARCSGIFQSLAAYMDFMVCDRGRRFRGGLFLCFSGCAASWLGLIGWAGCGSWRWWSISPPALAKSNHREEQHKSDQERRGAHHHFGQYPP